MQVIRTASKNFFSKCFVYKGRCSRPEFWWPVFIFIVPIYTAVSMLDISAETPTLIYAVARISQVVLFVPLISAIVRRLHDLDISGWWFLTGIGVATLSVGLALGGIIWLEEKRYFYFFYGFLFVPLILVPVLCFKGTDRSNRFDI